MKLLAELYLDEDVSVLVGTLLRARGIDVTTARDQAMLRQADPAQLEHAVSLGRCVFTHNRLHYERLHAEYIQGGRPHFGIVIGSRRSPHELARRLALLLNHLAAGEIEDQRLYI